MFIIYGQSDKVLKRTCDTFAPNKIEHNEEIEIQNF